VCVDVYTQTPVDATPVCFNPQLSVSCYHKFGGDPTFMPGILIACQDHSVSGWQNLLSCYSVPQKITVGGCWNFGQLSADQHVALQRPAWADTSIATALAYYNKCWPSYVNPTAAASIVCPWMTTPAANTYQTYGCIFGLAGNQFNPNIYPTVYPANGYWNNPDGRAGIPGYAAKDINGQYVGPGNLITRVDGACLLQGISGVVMPYTVQTASATDSNYCGVSQNWPTRNSSSPPRTGYKCYQHQLTPHPGWVWNPPGPYATTALFVPNGAVANQPSGCFDLRNKGNYTGPSVYIEQGPRPQPYFYVGLNATNVPCVPRTCGQASCTNVSQVFNSSSPTCPDQMQDYVNPNDGLYYGNLACDYLANQPTYMPRFREACFSAGFPDYYYMCVPNNTNSVAYISETSHQECYSGNFNGSNIQCVTLPTRLMCYTSWHAWFLAHPVIQTSLSYLVYVLIAVCFVIMVGIAIGFWTALRDNAKNQQVVYVM